MFRDPKTFAERRYIAGVVADIATGTMIVELKTRSSRNSLPCDWDDLPYSRKSKDSHDKILRLNHRREARKISVEQ